MALVLSPGRIYPVVLNSDTGEGRVNFRLDDFSYFFTAFMACCSAVLRFKLCFDFYTATVANFLLINYSPIFVSTLHSQTFLLVFYVSAQFFFRT